MNQHSRTAQDSFVQLTFDLSPRGLMVEHRHFIGLTVGIHDNVEEVTDLGHKGT
ncbi:hypothetical protein DPMN_093862 [Dreissena polymorpha]|uniref:Uncharacterized protein n=1 Tax=Dreissena polymorpha TaxID=45954 RepID=A0A9D4L6B9_DREPO|nr:hypothetical protein DPMN_093862 [Dreissena polymorpha]